MKKLIDYFSSQIPNKLFKINPLILKLIELFLKQRAIVSMRNETSNIVNFLNIENKEQFILEHLNFKDIEQDLKVNHFTPSTKVNRYEIVEKFLQIVRSDRYLSPKLIKELFLTRKILNLIDKKSLSHIVLFTTYNLRVSITIKQTYPSILIVGLQHGLTINNMSPKRLNALIGCDIYYCWYDDDIEFFDVWWAQYNFIYKQPILKTLKNLIPDLNQGSNVLNTSDNCFLMLTIFSDIDYADEITKTFYFLKKKGVKVNFNIHPAKRFDLFFLFKLFLKMKKDFFSMRVSPPRNSCKIVSNGSTSIIEYALRGYEVFWVNIYNRSTNFVSNMNIPEIK